MEGRNPMLTVHAILSTSERTNPKSVTCDFYDEADTVIRNMYAVAAKYFRTQPDPTIESHVRWDRMMMSFEMRSSSGDYAVAHVTGEETPEDISFDEWEEEHYPA
jgi:hypothetical protein